MQMQQMLKQLQGIVCQHAAEQIMSRYNHVAYRVKEDGSLVTQADCAMQREMIKSLQAHWPAYAILGEEMSAAAQQAQLDCDGQGDTQGLWILDPLDGTSNFANAIPVFSVSIALVIKREVVLGLIFDPVRNEVFSAIKGEGAWLNGQQLISQSSCELLSQSIAQIDFKRLTPQMRVCLSREHPYASQRNFGSGALDWCWLAAGRSQVYIHGGQKLWDYVAGQLILSEAGGIAKTFDGERVFKASLEPRSVMASVNETLFAQLQRYLTSIECRKRQQ
ncbi:Inositol-1-monophosphatase [hydrothermal vent metagenome]|uniref:Inositol-1-monophosphatase n=1 Tax=hydrothermal vent metagenome TaxID=652676 RepID=A0A3B0Y9N3_9ZZZZ